MEGEKNVPERRSGLLPSEKELPERRSGAFRHKNTPGVRYRLDQRRNSESAGKRKKPGGTEENYERLQSVEIVCLRAEISIRYVPNTTIRP
jgi:hypothetical protein